MKHKTEARREGGGVDLKTRRTTEARSEAGGVRLWLLLWKASKSLEAHARRSVEATGLCLTDFGVLEAILHKGPLTAGALGRKVLLTSGSMTAAVDRLERRGLVARAGDPSDRRASLVRLTASGDRLIRRLFADHRRDMERAVSGLRAREAASLAALLRKLGRAAEELDSNERKRS